MRSGVAPLPQRKSIPGCRFLVPSRSVGRGLLSAAASQPGLPRGTDQPAPALRPVVSRHLPDPHPQFRAAAQRCPPGGGTALRGARQPFPHQAGSHLRCAHLCSGHSDFSHCHQSSPGLHRSLVFGPGRDDSARRRRSHRSAPRTRGGKPRTTGGALPPRSWPETATSPVSSVFSICSVSISSPSTKVTASSKPFPIRGRCRPRCRHCGGRTCRKPASAPFAGVAAYWCAPGTRSVTTGGWWSAPCCRANSSSTSKTRSPHTPSFRK